MPGWALRNDSSGENAGVGVRLAAHSWTLLHVSEWQSPSYLYARVDLESEGWLVTSVAACLSVDCGRKVLGLLNPHQHLILSSFIFIFLSIYLLF